MKYYLWPDMPSCRMCGLRRRLHMRDELTFYADDNPYFTITRCPLEGVCMVIDGWERGREVIRIRLNGYDNFLEIGRLDE